MLEICEGSPPDGRIGFELGVPNDRVAFVLV